MLEPWIIEQIRRQEEEERQRNERPRLEIPAVDERHEHWRKRNDERREKGERGDRDEPDKKDDDQPERGVMIIDFGVS
jgi:hypothetical protein